MNNLVVKNQNNRDSVREYVYKTIRNNIMDLNLKPGKSISEKEISELLQVSRTPVREAFILLEQDGLLEIYPQKGTFVSLIDLERVEEARFLRETMELAVIKLACDNFPEEKLIELISNVNMQELYSKTDLKKLYKLDEEFHLIIFEGVNKKNIWFLIRQLSTHMNRVRMLSAIYSENSDLIIGEHKSILEAIKNKDYDKGSLFTKEHLSHLMFDQKKLKKEFPSYFKS